MLKYVSNFFLQILPSVVATVVGAYIVNHYIAPKSGEATKAAAYSKANPADDEGAVDVTPRPEAAEKAAAERAVAERLQAEKAAAAADAAKQAEARKAAAAREKLARRPEAKTEAKAEAKSEARTDVKTEAKAEPAPAAVAPVEERRDATELARAAIERLRGEARASEPRPENRPATTVAIAPAAPRPAAVQPLPPPVVVAAPGPALQQPPVSAPAPQQASAEGPRRLVPPGEIPAGRPIDLAVAGAPVPKTTVAEDVLSAARSVIQHVVPQ
jgi:chemotaxis protein histidine kinase CheA